MTVLKVLKSKPSEESENRSKKKKNRNERKRKESNATRKMLELQRKLEALDTVEYAMTWMKRSNTVGSVQFHQQIEQLS